MKTVWRFLKKLKTEVPDNTGIQKNAWIHMFIVALSIIAKTYKQPKCPSIDKWIKKMWYIYTMEYYLTMKRME